jgi:transcriptional regulator with XRE-family HTH domain
MSSQSSSAVERPLRRFRKPLGWSQRQLAARADVDHRRIHLYEHGLRVSDSDKQRLAEAFGTGIGEALE